MTASPYENVYPKQVQSCLLLSKCCFCIPLKTGCFILGYMSLVLNIIISLFFVGTLAFLAIYTHGFRYIHMKHTEDGRKVPDEDSMNSAQLRLTVICILLVGSLNIAWFLMNIVLLVGLHRDSLSDPDSLLSSVIAPEHEHDVCSSHHPVQPYFREPNDLLHTPPSAGLLSEHDKLKLEHKRPGHIKVHVTVATFRLLLSVVGIVMYGAHTTNSMIACCSEIVLSAYFILLYYVYAVQLEREQISNENKPVSDVITDVVFSYPQSIDKATLTTKEDQFVAV